MTKLKYVLIIFISTLLFYGCYEDIKPKYQRPEWLVGKVYTQMMDVDTLSMFSKCVKLVNYDSIIDISGSYTVFAPTNDAMEKWLQKNQYSSVEDVPTDELLRLVKFHIVQDAWSKLQLRTLDINGWIDTLDISNNEPRGFKRMTLLKEKNRNYGVVKKYKEPIAIIDTLKSNWVRKIITDSRKFVPFFYSEYFTANNLNISDYEFYFDRPFEGGDNIYFENAKILGNEIFAENGFVYKIDAVAEPLKNAYEILEEKKLGYSYSKYLDLANHFPDFEYNEQKTKEQPGAESGAIVDSLFNVNYPDLVFDILNEKTSPPEGTTDITGNGIYRYHNGIFPPTNTAFDQLVNKFINVPGGWGNIDALPLNIKKIIVNTYMSYNPVYPTNINQGFYNGEKDMVYINESDIIEKRFASNCTFLGINKPVVPRAFSSVVGPVYLQPGYSWVMSAIETSRMLPALKRPNKNFMFFVEPDTRLREDSSLMYNKYTEEYKMFNRNTKKFAKPKSEDLRSLLLNHVAIDQRRGIARKEFIRNLAGNFIIFNNISGEVSGTGTTTYGFNGDSVLVNKPVAIPINIDIDNGSTYKIDNWFSFNNPTIYSAIQSKFPTFFALMDKAGLIDRIYYRFKFLSDNDFYTVFIPSNEALSKFDTSQLSKEELAKFIMLHFVQGEFIFTDGNNNSGYYTTTRVDDRSTTYTTINSKIYIETGIDYIKISSKDGSNYTQIDESDKTNILTGVNVQNDNGNTPLIQKMYNNAVIHQIDTVLVYDQLDVR